MMDGLYQSIPSTSPMVSIIVPVYDRLEFLDSTIVGVLDQAYECWELIVVDDGSQEDVQEFVAHYADPRVSFLRQPNQGNAAARNTGIGCARGENVVCLDSDDVWHPALLETCVSWLAAHPDVDVVFTQVQTIDSNGRPLPRPVVPTPHNGDLLEPLLMGYPILPSSAVMRRLCFERWGAYTVGLDDWELWLRWAAQGCRFACIEQPLLQYRLHDQNFGLDWPRRRAAHFATLDTFYAREKLPQAAYRLRDRAYANQHFVFAVLAWQVGRPEDGLAESNEAVFLNREYLHDLDFYAQLACAHQGRVDAGSSTGLDLDVAERSLRRSLDALFVRSGLSPAILMQRRSAYGWAYLTLARLAYGVAHDMGYARRFLLRSAAAWPAVLWRTDWAAWQARALVGHKALQAIKGKRVIAASCG